MFVLSLYLHRNGIYPLMNFAVSRPHALPRALSQPQEDTQKAKTPTPEPFDVETRKVRSDPGGDSSPLGISRKSPFLTPYCRISPVSHTPNSRSAATLLLSGAGDVHFTGDLLEQPHCF